MRGTVGRGGLRAARPAGHAHPDDSMLQCIESTHTRGRWPVVRWHTSAMAIQTYAGGHSALGRRVRRPV